MPARTKRRTLLWRFGAGIMATQIIVVLILTPYARSKIERFHYDQTVGELDRLGAVLTDVLGDGSAPIQEQADRVRRRSGARITVIDSEGTVLVDTHHDPATMENHRYRREVADALSHGQGSSVRFSGTIDREMIYVAQRAALPDGSDVVIRTALPRQRVDRERSGVVRTIGVAGLVLVLVTLLITYLVTRRLGAVVSTMADGAARFADGDLEHRIERPSTAELAVLADALNDMARQVSDQFDRLDAQGAELRAVLESMSNGVLALDGSQRILTINRAAEAILGLAGARSRDRLLQEVVREPELNRFVEDSMESGAPRRAEVHLTSRLDSMIEAVAQPLRGTDGTRSGLLVVLNDVTQIRRLESMRSDFAANVSHELRTPITAIKGYVETLLELCEEDPQQSQFLTVVYDNASRLEAIIEDLLSLARIERTEDLGEIECVPCPVDQVVAAALDHVEDAAQQRHVTITCDVEPDLEVNGAAILLEQAVVNILSNAVRYGGAGGRIEIEARRGEADMVEIAVTDHGPGIPREHLDRLFERFYRVDQARSRAVGGTGLGLAIVKHVALVHGGRAEVESVVGRGSTFRLVLPAASSP